MLNLFFDTSALVKIFHKEIGSDTVMKLIQLPDVNLWMSELAKLEFMSALHRRLRINELTENQLEEALNVFEKEWIRFRIEPLGSGILIEAQKLIKIHARKVGLRTLGALHLATFQLISEKGWKFVVADKILANTAMKLNTEVFNPLEDKVTNI